MGQGPSSRSSRSARRGLPSRSSIIVNSNGSIINVNTDPDPLFHPNPDSIEDAEGGSSQHNINNNNNNSRVPSPLESATYLHQRKSTSSLSRIFMNRKWKTKRRGSISASFSVNENDIKVNLLFSIAVIFSGEFMRVFYLINEMC